MDIIIIRIDDSILEKIIYNNSSFFGSSTEKVKQIDGVFRIVICSQR